MLHDTMIIGNIIILLVAHWYEGMTIRVKYTVKGEQLCNDVNIGVGIRVK